ncbi:MAG TPA: HAMP domain-containing sensor histidine kinase [Nitrososphaeraceae archaeon]|jgi:signal transduction histidine kinase
MNEKSSSSSQEKGSSNKAEFNDTNKNLIEINKQLLEVNEQLKIQNRKLQDFIDIAAHELRTPIMPIIGYADILREDIGEKKEITGIIYNARRLEQLAENILDSTKIENQTLKLNKEQFNLNDIILDMVQDYENQNITKEKNGIKLLYEPKDIFLEADKLRLSRVISNLLNNAIHFTKNGNITITTKETKTNDNDNTKLEQKEQVLVSIKDTGPGIPSILLQKLFSKFISTASSGTGLGLFVSKSIVKAHGGEIWAENNPDGEGATFSFRIPKIQVS